MNIHEQIEDWMAAALAGGLSQEEKTAFEKHLGECAACRNLYKEEKMIALMMEKALVTNTPPPGFETRITTRFRRELDGKKSFFNRFRDLFFSVGRTRYALPILAAASVLILVQLGGVLTGERGAVQRARETLGTGGIADPSMLLPHAVGESWALLPSVRNELVGNEGTFGDKRLSCSVIGGPADGPIAATDGFRSKDSRDEKGNVYGEDSLKNRESKSKSDSSGLKASDQVARLEGNVRQLDAQSLLGTAPASGVAGTAYVSTESEKEFAKKEKTVGQIQSKSAPVSVKAEPPAIGVPDQRKLIRNARMDFEVESFEAALQQIARIAKEENGFIATTGSSRLANGKVQGDVVVKVLPENLESALARLKALGELKNQSLTTQDITKAYFDTDARLRNSRRMEERLLEMLDKARGKVTELLEVEKELGRVREQIEQMQGELKVYDALVQFATITIHLSEKDLDEAAAFLLKERARLSLFSPDVEKTFREAKQEAEAAKAQILNSNLNRDSSGRVSAVLNVLVAPEQSEGLLARFKGMGRVHDLTWQNERISQGGGERSDSARVKKDKVEIHLTILHDDESRKRVNLTVVAKGIEEALEKAKAEALARGAEVLSSNLEQAPNGQSTGRLNVRVPAKTYVQLMAFLQGLGRTANLAVQRNDPLLTGQQADEAPALVALILTNEEIPLQQTHLSVLTKEVEEKVAQIKQAAAAMGADLRSSTFERSPDGREFGNLTFRIPMGKNSALVEAIKALGKLKEFTIQRQDRVGENRKPEEATAEISLRVYSQGHLVTEETGFFQTLRRTVSQGVEALMWSLRMIGVAVAFLAPWVIAGVLIGWLVKRIRSRNKPSS